METNQPKKLFISNDRYVMFDPLNFIEFSPNFFQSALTKRDVNLITSEMKKNSSHELIMLEKRGLTDASVKTLCSILKSNPNLRSLILTNNYVSNEGAKHIGELLKEHSGLKSCILIEQIGIVGLKYLTDGLMKNTSLDTFCLISSYLSDEASTSIAKLINKCTSLLSLSIRSENITEKGIRNIGDVIVENTNLIEFDFFGDTGSQAVAQVLKKLKNLKKLRLYGAFNTPIEKSSVFIDAFQRYCSKVEELTIRDNYVDVSLLCKTLITMRRVHTLELCNSCVIDEDMEHLSNLLSESDCIKSLNISSNNITDSGAETLLKGINASKSITDINLTDTDVSPSCMQVVLNVLKSSREKREKRSEPKLEMSYLLATPPDVMDSPRFEIMASPASKRVSGSDSDIEYMIDDEVLVNTVLLTPDERLLAEMVEVSLEGSQVVYKNLGIRTENLTNILRYLIEEKRYSEIGRLLSLSPNIHEIISFGNETAVHFAARLGDLHLLEVLVENGASLTVQDRFGNTPLHVAILHKNKDVASWILQVDENQESTNDHSVLDHMSNDLELPIHSDNYSNESILITLLDEMKLLRRQNEDLKHTLSIVLERLERIEDATTSESLRILRQRRLSNPTAAAHTLIHSPTTSTSSKVEDTYEAGVDDKIQQQ